MSYWNRKIDDLKNSSIGLLKGIFGYILRWRTNVLTICNIINHYILLVQFEW